MKKSFEVVSCNPTINKKKQKGFCIKLQTTITKDIGIKWSTTRYYYLFSDVAAKKGMTLKIDLSECNVVQRKLEVEDGKEVTLNFLYIKG